jgi:protein-tyrosine-phosphatase
MELTDERQSLVSYHLRELHEGQLVTRRRSSADGRDTYYAIDLQRCRTDMQASAAALHPGLWSPSPADPPRRTRRLPTRVLFLCTGNSARSQIAEALTDRLSEGRVIAASAGSDPKALHPNAVRVMRRRGIDIAGNRSKHLDGFVGQRFDLVVTLCDRVREVCPEFPSASETTHWSIPDPNAERATLRASYPAFERTAAEIEIRIPFMLDALASSTTRS